MKETRTVRYEIYVDDKCVGRVPVREGIYYDTDNDMRRTYRTSFNGKPLPIHRTYGGILKCRLDFKTIKSATIAELLAELALRLDPPKAKETK